MEPQDKPAETPALENSQAGNEIPAPAEGQPSGAIPSVPPEPAATVNNPAETAPPTDPTQLLVPQPPVGSPASAAAPPPAKKNKVLFKIILALVIVIVAAVAIVALLR
jgi:hypothetical protein